MRSRASFSFWFIGQPRRVAACFSQRFFGIGKSRRLVKNTEAIVANFVLTPIPGGWQGAEGAKPIIGVTSTDPTVVLQGAVCSSANPKDLTPANGKVTFALAKGAQVLTVQVNKVFPLPDWQVVEFDDAGNTQPLAAVLASQNSADPFSVNIIIKGV
jgi:hypothetical protein